MFQQKIKPRCENLIVSASQVESRSNGTFDNSKGIRVHAQLKALFFFENKTKIITSIIIIIFHLYYLIQLSISICIQLFYERPQSSTRDMKTTFSTIEKQQVVHDRSIETP